MMPTDPILDIDPERFSLLYDLATSDTDTLDIDLSPDEHVVFLRIQRLTDLIDEAWQIPEDQTARMQRALLEQIAIQFPDHPWLRGNLVQTLGDLVQEAGDDLPALPPASYEKLAADATPVEALTDPRKRVPILGQAIDRAALPESFIPAFVFWVNRTFRDLVQPTNSPGLVHARRQGPRKRDAQE